MGLLYSVLKLCNRTFERQARTNIGLDNLLMWIHALKITPADVFGSSDLEQINQKLDVIINQTK